MRFCRSLIAGATALLLSVPAYATTIPSVASGEAADRESALTSALRHAIEQVVGMSVNTSTYVSNLKSIQDKIYTGATGYIESYEVVDEQRTPAGYRVTVSAKVAKEKLTSAVAPIIGDGAIKLDGKLALDNLRVGLESQKDAERTLKALLDELTESALKFTFSSPQFKTSTSNPDWVEVTLDQFRVELNEDWYERYRSFCKTIMTSIISQEVFKHGRDYAGREARIDVQPWPYSGSSTFVVELYNDRNEIIHKTFLQDGMGGSVSVKTGRHSLFEMESLPVIPPSVAGTSQVRFVVPAHILKHVAKLKVRNPRYENWPVPL